MARGLSQPISHILSRNRAMVETARAQIAESKALCSASRDLIRRIKNVEEFVHESVLTSRTLRRGTPQTAIDGAAQPSRQPKQERLELPQSMAARSPSESNRDFKKVGLHFLLTEIAAGLTFAAMAESKNETEAARSRGRARAAYDAVVRFSDRVPLTQEERRELLAVLSKLKLRLRALGEQF